MDRANRVLWTVIGLVLLVGGILVALASAGWLPGAQTGSPLLWNELIDQWREWEPWVWLAIVLVGLIIAWLGWRLIRAQLRVSDGRAMEDLEIDAPDGRGRTFVDRSTLSRATRRDLEHIRGVDGAVVRLLGDRDRPDVRARLIVRPDAALPAVAADVTQALGRFRETSGLEPGAVEVTVHADGGTPPRVK